MVAHRFISGISRANLGSLCKDGVSSPAFPRSSAQFRRRVFVGRASRHVEEVGIQTFDERDVAGYKSQKGESADGGRTINRS